MPYTRHHRVKARFTLIEILVVIALMMLLAALLFPVVGTVFTKARNAKTIEQLKILGQALEEYKSELGFYPVTTPIDIDTGTGTPIELTKGFLDTHWAFKYSSNTAFQSIWGRYDPTGTVSSNYKLIDPFQGPIWYQCPGTMNPQSYDLWSTGRDTQHGDGGGNNASDVSAAQTRSENDDITNWKSDF